MSRYIDADEFEKYINREEWKTPDEKWWPEREIGMILDAITTADVREVVHGEWIPRTNLPKQEIFICSVCGGWAYSPWIGNRKNPKPNWCKYKYCPNCGADMRGGTE